MPELPEVETVRRTLAPHLVGRRLPRPRRAAATSSPAMRHRVRSFKVPSSIGSIGAASSSPSSRAMGAP
ncbi:MAG: DNA-formamidopyrimidine glycosylase family protein [Phycisphaerales bacterium]